MRYFVVDCISGTKGDKGCANLEDAYKKRDEWTAKDKEEGGSGELWIVIDAKGNEY